MPSENDTAVILMSYGSPTRMEDVRAYLEEIYEGREVPEYALRENLEKYAMVKGVSPSNAIIDTLIEKIKGELGSGFTVRLANKHWMPRVHDVLSGLMQADIRKIIAIPLFPFPSINVRDSYLIPLREAMHSLSWEPRLDFVEGFSDQIGFLETWLDILKPYVDMNAHFIFDAHSLPTFRHPEDEYDVSFHEASRRIAERAGIESWSAGYQSRGKYGSSWLEPSVYKVLDSIKAENKRENIVAIPVGFCYEHLEVLYDLDHEFGDYVKKRGFGYVRTPLPDHRDRWVGMFTEIIRRRSVEL